MMRNTNMYDMLKNQYEYKKPENQKKEKIMGMNLNCSYYESGSMKICVDKK
jgi:hypothetical protein